MAERRHPYGYYLGKQGLKNIQENLRWGDTSIEVSPNANPNFYHPREHFEFNNALKSFKSQVCESCPLYRTSSTKNPNNVDVSCSGLIPEQREASVTFHTPKGREIFTESSNCQVVFQEELKLPQQEG